MQEPAIAEPSDGIIELHTTVLRGLLYLLPPLEGDQCRSATTATWTSIRKLEQRALPHLIRLSLGRIDQNGDQPLVLEPMSVALKEHQVLATNKWKNFI